MQLCKYQQAINLSKTELKLLSYFLNNPRQIITREQFLQHLWDSQGDDLDENTLAVNIRRLREKIEDDPSRPRYIKTVRGIGYIWGERCVSD
jgi:DNA-binding response OmpR family regulator